MNISEQPKRSLLARILSLEGAMAAFGLYSLVSGFMAGEVLQIFWGVMILAGLGILLAVRRRDWQQHWAALEAASLRQAHPAPAQQSPAPEDEGNRRPL